MNARPVLIAAVLVLVVGSLGVQLWLLERQQDLRGRQLALHNEAVARWEALPRGPGRILPPRPHYYPPTNPPPFLLWQAPLMSVFALVAVAHEEKKRKQREAEEEARTTYTEEDLMADWEFKIVRSPVGLFCRPAFLARVLAEEAAGGWRLVEKFDGHRVRLKRPAGSLPSSATWPTGYDPFRTTVGPKARTHASLWALSAFCAVVVVMAMVAMAVMPGDATNAAVVGMIATSAAVGLGWLAVRAKAKFDRLAG